VLSHPNKSNETPRSLLTARYEPAGEYFQWSDAERGAKRLWLLNRLDSATSGVILVATSEAQAAAIRLHFRQKRVRKIYHALVFGRPVAREQHWRDRLAVEKSGGKIRTRTAGHIPAECQMILKRSGGPLGKICSLLQLEPITGRSHQLRVQCAKRNLPIVGDQTYGDFAHNREFAKRTGNKRLFLHSLRTEFDYEFNGRSFHFVAEAPLPAEFVAAY
jgi:23S rRNA-/tRNA-specific pseudouridylate synthase